MANQKEKKNVIKQPDVENTMAIAQIIQGITCCLGSGADHKDNCKICPYRHCGCQNYLLEDTIAYIMELKSAYDISVKTHIDSLRLAYLNKGKDDDRIEALNKEIEELKINLIKETCASRKEIKSILTELYMRIREEELEDPENPVPVVVSSKQIKEIAERYGIHIEE